MTRSTLKKREKVRIDFGLKFTKTNKDNKKCDLPSIKNIKF